MNRNRIITIVVVVVFVVVAGIVLLTKRGSQYGAGGPGGANGTAPAGPVTRETVPSNTVVVIPEVGAKNVPANVAVPDTVAPAGGPQRGDSRFRSFDIKISNNQFQPSDVNAIIGDTVRISVTAVDGKYDYTQPDYGWSVSLAKGETKATQFDATAEGRFKIFCKSCGGPNSGPVGYLTVVPKQ